MGRGPILLVDDDESILDLVQMALEFEGYDVVLADGGRRALDLLASTTPSLILLDMHMPEVNGWEFAKAYMDGRKVRAPVLIMTAGHDAARAALDIGADGYIGKPFDIDELVAAVGKYLPP